MMRAMRIALVAALALAALVATVAAQPEEGGIEMDPDPVGSGSAAGSAQAPGSGSASATPTDTGSAAQTQPDQPAAPVKDPKAARKWLAAAQTLAQKGDYYTARAKPDDAKAQYENAATAYEKAIEAGDDVGVNYAYAVVLDKLGRFADAYKKLKLVVAPGATVKADIAKKAQTKLDEVSMKIGIVTLQVTPEGTTISLAGQEIGEAPLSEPLILDPGTYTLTLAAVGYQPKDAEIKVEAGSESERKIELEPVKMVIKKDEPEPIEAPPVVKAPSKLPLYVGAGATGAFLLGATITGILAVGQHGTFTDPDTLPLDRDDAKANGRMYAHVTDVFLVGAVGAAAFTTYWYFKKYRPATRTTETHSDEPKMSVVPWVQGPAGGFVVGGSF
jgi:hypothetical protein